ncbi:hypothetical protein H8B06_09005 [Sphingobacterium sp. DN00404]|uniref:Uncharacterized protein n=1 Tax=Sphingobacterium micropteri TaxID=2763501 RepID=A0ABR7YNS7_9SPHI|nr:hypothetical protein [Sphingobacterium micropteri]MBD1432962.1 hypothetical protein [Sphingobacterium micropteri]
MKEFDSPYIIYYIDSDGNVLINKIISIISLRNKWKKDLPFYWIVLPLMGSR